MTDETDNQDTAESASADDERFEVKWKKKEGSQRSATATPETAVPQDAQALQRELEEAQERIRNLQDRWQRAAADLANLRRRTEQERGDMEKFASMLLVSELLPVLDNFERATATIPGNLAMLTWIQGVMLIERHFRAILEHQGLEPIEAEGQPFSPHYHEAVSERETSDAAPGTILQVYQKGYTMHGRVIRPALVEVARATTEQPAPPVEPGSEAPEQTGDAEAEEIVSEAETGNVGP